jgi:hypothetical protein
MKTVKYISCTLLLILCTNTVYGKNDSTIYKNKKPGAIILSYGMGYPALLSYIVVKNANNQIVIEQAQNPIMAKAEFKKGRLGIAATFTTNFQRYRIEYNIMNHSRIQWNLYSINARFNYYLLDKHLTLKLGKIKAKQNWQGYIGGGGGYVNATQKTGVVQNPLLTPTIENMYENLPLSFEATLGSRYFINKYIGIWGEAGIGNIAYQWRDKGVADSYLQWGLSMRIPF